MLIPISVLVYCVAGGIKVRGPLLKLFLISSMCQARQFLTC